MSKNNILTYFLMYFRQKSARGATLPTTPLPVDFTAITDHPKAREVPPGCGLQSSGVPVRIPVSFWSQSYAECRGGGFSVWPALSIFLSGQLVLHTSGQIPEIEVLYNTHSK
jgi:hypothetical protein